MRNSLSLKHWRMAIAVLAVFAAVAPARSAFGQFSPDTDSFKQKQIAGSGTIQLQGSMAEGRNNGHILDVWRANDSTNAVWLSYDNGKAFQIGKTTTMATPAVSAWGNNGAFIAFHTGTDGRINYTFVYGGGSTQNSGTWMQIPAQITPPKMGVSAAPIGEGSEEIIVAYRASGGNDQRTWATWMDNDGAWSTAHNFGGGDAVATPAICLDNVASSLWAIAIGTDNQVWTTHQKLGASSWPYWTPQGIFVSAPEDGSAIQPGSGAAADNGNVVLAASTGQDASLYKVVNSSGGTVHDWVVTDAFSTLNAVDLVSAGPTVFALLTEIEDRGANNASFKDVGGPLSGFVYWTQIYDAP